MKIEILRTDELTAKELDLVTGGVAGGVAIKDPEPLPITIRPAEPVVQPGDFL